MCMATLAKLLYASPRGIFMLDSGFMPPCCLGSSDRNVHGELLPLGIKQRCSCLCDENYCLHYVLILMQLSVALMQLFVACNLIPERFAG